MDYFNRRQQKGSALIKAIDRGREKGDVGSKTCWQAEVTDVVYQRADAGSSPV